MNLEQLQRTFFELIRQPLTSNERLRTRTLEGRSIRALADELITPSARLTSFERLELYSQGYWFRILEAFDRDFRGLRTVVGKPRFERLARGYLGLSSGLLRPRSTRQSPGSLAHRPSALCSLSTARGSRHCAA
jgi:Putative DNA-binding domain